MSLRLRFRDCVEISSDSGDEAELANDGGTEDSQESKRCVAFRSLWLRASS